MLRYIYKIFNYIFYTWPQHPPSPRPWPRPTLSGLARGSRSANKLNHSLISDDFCPEKNAVFNFKHNNKWLPKSPKIH